MNSLATTNFYYAVPTTHKIMEKIKMPNASNLSLCTGQVVKNVYIDKSGSYCTFVASQDGSDQSNTYGVNLDSNAGDSINNALLSALNKGYLVDFNTSASAIGGAVEVIDLKVYLKK